MSDYDPNYISPKNYFLLGVKVILRNAHGQVLLLKRSEKTSRPGGWDFPGGAVDRHETFEDAAERELNEEIGIEINSFTPLGSLCIPHGESDEAMIFAYTAFIENDSAIALSWEHSSYEWVAFGDLSEYPLPPSYRYFLSQI